MTQTPDTRRPRDAGATRGLLLAAAMRRFTVAGYASTTVREIAQDAGVNVALINRYFGSKEGLFEACLTEAASELRRTAGEGVPGLGLGDHVGRGPDGGAARVASGGAGSGAAPGVASDGAGSGVASDGAGSGVALDGAGSGVALDGVEVGAGAGGGVDARDLADAITRQAIGTVLPGGPPHALLLVLRSSGDPAAERLRLGLLRTFSDRVAAAAGARGGLDPDELLLRAQVVLAAAVGIAVLRSSGGLEPLSSAGHDQLLGPVTDLVAALLGNELRR